MAYRVKATDLADGAEKFLPTGETAALKVEVGEPNVLLGRLTTGAGGHEEINPAALTAETTPASGDFLLIWTGDGLRKVDFGEFGGGGGGASFLVYTALISQVDTDDPVATVLENTLGGTVVWTRLSTGRYVGELTGAFPNGKCWFSACVDDRDLFDNEYYARVYRVDSDTVRLNMKDSGTSDIDQFANLSVEIRVYP